MRSPGSRKILEQRSRAHRRRAAARPYRPSRQTTFTLPLRAFPPTLEADVEAYLRRASGVDLSDDHFARAQRPATIITRRWHLRLLADSNRDERHRCGPLVDLRTMLTPRWLPVVCSIAQPADDPDLFKAFCEEFHREVNRLRAGGNAAAEAKRTDLDRIERRIRRIVELITDDDAPVRALKQELVDLEARQLSLQQELAPSDAPAPLIHPNLAEVYRQRVAHDALQDQSTRDEAFTLIRSLIDETAHAGEL
jgi:hypothetical protein